MKVLICDDDPIERALLVEALRSLNCDVVEATNGSEGVALAKKELPELILMDYAMPQMNGLEAMKTIRQEIPLQDVPFVMITGSYDVQALVDQEQAARAAFLPKPYSLNQLQATISLVLGHSFP